MRGWRQVKSDWAAVWGAAGGAAAAMRASSQVRGLGTAGRQVQYLHKCSFMLWLFVAHVRIVTVAAF